LQGNIMITMSLKKKLAPFSKTVHASRHHASWNFVMAVKTGIQVRFAEVQKAARIPHAPE
jgi:hypothetical protein